MPTPPPDPDHWARLSAVFDAVADLPPDARAEALDRLCRTPDGAPDAALRSEVEALLAVDTPTGNDAGIGLPAAAALVGDLYAPARGERIGPWRVLRPIGRGGMGRVDLVERADGTYTQQAALKRLSLVAPSRVRRFLRERQILASLQHPGIARLLDGGVADGAPYLVMEYVEGEPITVWADRHELGLRDRLRLFLQVCDAVAYAHRHLVVHRDLKPSNVLVGEPAPAEPSADDATDGRDTDRRNADGRDDAHVTLLDFGIAHLLDADAAEPLTADGPGAPLTPGYAAPEQIDGGTITTATDVWALGVLLYELVTGLRPFRESTREAWIEAVRRADPSPPSAVVRTADSTTGMRSPADARRLRGDLDAICLTALRRAPENRYASARELGQDLRRYLAGEAVEAHRPSAADRLRRFVRRHRAAVAVGALGAVLLAAGAAAFVVRVTTERDRAEAAAAEAAAVTETLVAMFDRDPFAADLGRLDTVSVGRFVLAQGDAAADRLRDRPRVQARLLTLVAQLHVRLGDTDRALDRARRAVALVDSLGGPPSEAALLAHDELGTVLWARGEPEAAVAEHRRALALAQAVYRRDHPTTVQVLASLGNALGDTADSTAVAEGIAVSEDAVAMATRLHGPVHADVAHALHALSAQLYSAGRYEDAIAPGRRAVAVRRRLLGDRHPLVASSQSNVASALRRLDRPAEAVPLYTQAIRTYADRLGPDAAYLASAYYGRASALRDLGRLDEAAADARRALASDARGLPDGHPFLAYDHELIGEILVLQGRWADGEASLETALALYGAGADDATLADARAALGRAALRTGRVAAARRLLTAARPHVDGARLARVEADLASLAGR